MTNLLVGLSIGLSIGSIIASCIYRSRIEAKESEIEDNKRLIQHLCQRKHYN